MASTPSEGGGATAATAASPADYAARRRELLNKTGTPVAGFQPRRRRLAALTDAWLRAVFAAACDAAGTPPSTVALVAVGGYGRGELAPGSDLDLVLLHGDRDRSSVSALADKVWYPVWDSGVHLDHSVRTLDQARRLAGTDLPVLLGLLDARPVAGDQALVSRLRSGVLADWRASARRRLPELRAAWEERGARTGDLRHDIEPDLKEGRGGLRDAVCLRAVTASWVADRPHRDVDDVDDAVRRLADVRDALHLSTGRATGHLVLQEQDQVAEMLDLPDADALLQVVGASAAAVTHAADGTWRQALAAIRPRRSRFGRGRKPVPELLGPGLAEHDGEVVLTTRADPRHDSLLVLRMAARAARSGLAVSASSLGRLAAECEPLTEPWPEPARMHFVDLLGAGPALVPVWEALDQAGLVAPLVPEWRLVRHRPQRNAVHRWSVDRHLLQAAVCAAPMVRQVSRPDLLLVAALLHDIGKGLPGDHSAAGAPLAGAVATRIGFGPADAAVVERLVRHHLLLVRTATRRDLDDPAAVDQVAEVVGDRAVLELLAALTRADARATGPAAWNDWKAGLVDDLVRRVALRLADAPPPPPLPLTPAQRSLTEAGGLTVLVSPHDTLTWTVTVASPDRRGLFAAIAGVLALHRLSVRSAQIRTEAGMAVDVWTVASERDDPPRAEALRTDLVRALDGTLDVTARLMARDAGRRPAALPPPAPRVHVVEAASASATVVEVRAPDRPGLLHRLCRALTLMGVSVRAARVVTFGADVVDVFYLQDADRRPLGITASREVVRLLTDAAG